MEAVEKKIKNKRDEKGELTELYSVKDGIDTLPPLLLIHSR